MAPPKPRFRVLNSSLVLWPNYMDLQKIHRSQILKSVLAYAFDFVRIHQEQLQRGQTVEYLSGQTGNFIHVQNPEKEMENIRLLIRL